MRTSNLVTLAIVAVLVTAQAALAGATLKGVDFKLGRNPDGGVAARVTDANGAPDFGVLPNGAYTLSVAPGPGIPGLHLWVAGAAVGVVERDIQGADADYGFARRDLAAEDPGDIGCRRWSGPAPPFGIQLMRAPHRLA